MRRSFFIISAFLLLNLFIFGCAPKTPIAPVSNKITFDTKIGVGAQNVVALPVAKEGQPYAATIEPTGGTGPYVCASVPPNTPIIGTIILAQNCVIVGNAPVLSPGTTHGIYPVRFTITDANNVVSGPFELALEVVKSEQQQTQGAPLQQSQPLGNQFVEESKCTSPFDGKWTGHFTTDYTYELTKITPSWEYDYSTKSNSKSFDISFTLECFDVLKEPMATAPYGVILMNVTEFSTTFPDFNCEESCQLPQDFSALLRFAFTDEQDKYTFDDHGLGFEIEIPGNKLWNSIFIRKPKQPFTWTNEINTISDTYSWKGSKGDSPNSDDYPWNLFINGRSIIYDEQFEEFPVEGNYIKIHSSGCRSMTSSYTLTKFG